MASVVDNSKLLFFGRAGAAIDGLPTFPLSRLLTTATFTLTVSCLFFRAIDGRPTAPSRLDAFLSQPG